MDGQYTIRIREPLPESHDDDKWQITRYENVRTTEFSDGTPGGPTSDRLVHIEKGLTLGDIYGFQLNYRTTDASNEPIQVFSARDVYVWPATDQPGVGDRTDRVASFPFFGHWKDHTYRYIICTETFPAAKVLDWENLLHDAFEEWQEATDGMVKAERITTTPCSEISAIETLALAGQLAVTNDLFQTPLTVLQDLNSIFTPTVLLGLTPALEENEAVQEDDRLSEIRMFDNTGKKLLVSSFPEMLKDPFKACIFFARACVTSISGYSDPARSASMELTSADVTFKGSEFAGVGTSTKTNRPSDTSFSSCDGDHTDFTKERAYSTAVHEAGHAFGMSQFDVVDSVYLALGTDRDYHVAHPAVPDSVLNYDRKTGGKPEFAEPDCSPHPLDILAIYALYQTK